MLFLSEVLREERVALFQIEEHRWQIYFGPVHLATLNEQLGKFEPPSPSGSEDLPGSLHTPQVDPSPNDSSVKDVPTGV